MMTDFAGLDLLAVGYVDVLEATTGLLGATHIVTISFSLDKLS
jgi:hypothetical protein